MEKVKPELVDELLKGYEKPEDIIGENGLLKRLTKAPLERAMNAELTSHLGYEKHDPAGHNSGNSRNGATSKTVKGEFGEMVVETPRDRNGSFEPQILSKHQTRFEGFDDNEGRVENRAVYVAIGIDWEGVKDVLGLWTSGNEGAKFRLGVLTELRNRGVKDVLIVCVDGRKGFPQAIETVFPEARVQLCIVHMVRTSLNYVNWKERKLVAADWKTIYRAVNERQAAKELDEFNARWGSKYQAIGKLWKENWDRVTPFFEFPAEVLKLRPSTPAAPPLARQHW
jgi:transposase-like protein